MFGSVVNAKGLYSEETDLGVGVVDTIQKRLTLVLG